MNIRAIIVAITFFVAGGGLVGLLVLNPFDWPLPEGMAGLLGRSEPVGESSAEAPDADREILYWQAPMDPNYIRDEPGLSPMGMELIPVYADQVGDAGIVEIDPGFAQNMGVRTAAVRRADVPRTIHSVGALTYDDSQVYMITTKYAGWIENVRVHYIGEEVGRGEPLFEIFSPQLVNAQQEYLNALAYRERLEGSEFPDARRRAGALVDSARQRLRYWDVTDDQIAALEQAGETRRTIEVRSPVDGLVISKMDQALEGMMAQPGMNLYRVADLSTIWVEAEIYENDIPWVETGLEALVRIPSRSGDTFRGVVRYVYPSLDEATRTLRLSIELPNPDRDLRPQMYANVELDIPAAENVPVVPEEAVIRSGTRDVVIVDLANGRFAVREVALGLHGEGVWEVREGVEPGERVVVSAQFLIDSESNLQEAIRKLNSAEPALPMEGTEDIEGMGDMPGVPSTEEMPGATAPVDHQH